MYSRVFKRSAATTASSTRLTIRERVWTDSPTVRRLFDTNVSSASYTAFALTRDLPDSFGSALVEHYNHGENKEETVSISLAKSQHEDYVRAIREFGDIPTLSLPPAHDLADSVFVEDTAIVIRHNDATKALLLQPGHESRQPEVNDIRKVLQKILPRENIWEMADLDPYARCDGGDVMYTGRHLFVGVSERTNEEAVEVLENVFTKTNGTTQSPLPLIPVVLPPHAPVLHLKSAVTHMDAHTLVAPTAPWASHLLRSMRVSALGYDVIRIPDVLACNLVALPCHRRILLQDTPCEESRELLEQAARKRNMTWQWVNTAELAKKDAALTCCSILLP